MKPVCGFLLIVFLLLFENSFGQKENNSVLEKKVTLQVTAETIASILDKISIQAKIFFSYDASLIEADKKKDISVTDQSIRETLDLLFESRFEYKVMGDQVIIAKPDDGQPKKKAEAGDGRDFGCEISSTANSHGICRASQAYAQKAGGRGAGLKNYIF